MAFFRAECDKRKFLLSAESVDKAQELFGSHHKMLEPLKLTEIKSPEIGMKFRLGGGKAICTITKLKESTLSFTTSNEIAGKVDISLLPIEEA